MRSTITAAIATTISLLASPSSAETTYFSQKIDTSKGTMPACTPLSVDGSKTVTVRDLNKAWPKVRIKRSALEAMPAHVGFDQCVAAFSDYSGRVTPAHISALARGDLGATMPIEFAMMILGPPTERPIHTSMINPITGQPENTTTYMWLHTFGGIGPLSVALNVVGGVALGVAGATASVDALSVANVASSASFVTWQLSSLKGAKIVTIQVDDAHRISLLMAQ